MPSAGPELYAEIASYGASTIFEAADASGALSENLTPLDPSSVLVGPAHLVRCSDGDNGAIHRAIARAQPGEVLVVDAHGRADVAHVGEIMTSAAQYRGVAG